MLNLDKKNIFILLCFLLFGCKDNSNQEVRFGQKSLQTVGKTMYFKIYEKLKDSVDNWILNKIREYEAESIYNFQLDSLLCFNNDKTRFITARHLYVNVVNAKSDDLQYIYGEKINGNWFFFKGASIVIPRNTIKGNSLDKPLTYKQLHEIALKEIYSGYLKDNGEINEEWFTSHFENVGWCSTCKTTEDFQKSRLEDVKMLWLQRDTTKPIKQLP